MPVFAETSDYRSRLPAGFALKETPMEFHEKLQQLRKQRGLTQEALAEALLVSRTAISKWESGRGCPSIDSLKALSGFFSVSIDDLLSGEELLTIAQEDTQEKRKHLPQSGVRASGLQYFPFPVSSLLRSDRRRRHPGGQPTVPERDLTLAENHLLFYCHRDPCLGYFDPGPSDLPAYRLEILWKQSIPAAEHRRSAPVYCHPAALCRCFSLYVNSN